MIGSTFVIAAPGDLLQTFLNPTPDFDDRFGSSIAVIGNNVLIGAPRDDAAGSNAGAVHLFDHSTGNLLQTFFSPSLSPLSDNFGTSLASFGSVFLVGAPRDSGGDGAVYLLDGATGTPLRSFRTPVIGNAGGFGQSIAVIGDEILIGAHQDHTQAAGAWAAYLFNGQTGALVHTFLSPSSTSAQFGCTVSAVGDSILVGDHLDDQGATEAGAAHLFDRVTGTLVHSFMNPLSVFEDRFGHTVALVGDDAFIGNPQDDLGKTNAGAVYQYDTNTSNFLRIIQTSPPEEFAMFGFNVTAANNNI